MTKNKLKTFGLLVLSTSFLFGCGGSENSTPSSISLSLADDISGVMYKDKLDFSKFVKVTSNAAGQVYTVSAESLTPDTITIDENNLSSGLVTGVGECRVKITVLDKSVEASFTSYAYVSSFKTTSPGELLVGDTFNLDNYVTVSVNNPSNAQGVYFASSLNEKTAVIDEDGKTVKVVGSGKISIKVTDFTGKKMGYLSATAVSSFEKEIDSFLSKIGNNYTVFSTIDDEFVDAYKLIRTSDYAFYPYQFYLGTTSWGNRPAYQGLVNFPSNKVYVVSAEYSSENEGQVDVSTLKTVEKCAYGKDGYYAFDSFPSSTISGMNYASDGDEEYLSCSFTSAVNDALLGNVMGLSYSSGAFATVQARLKNIFEGTSRSQIALVISFITKDGSNIDIAIGDIGTTKVEGMDEYLGDASNEPEDISLTPMKERIQSVANAKNYTLKGRTYVRDDNGKELSVAEAASMAEILHLLYYTGTAKYTEDAVYIKNIQSYGGVASGTLSDHQFTSGYLNKDGKVYEITCEKDEKGNEVLGGTLSTSSDPISVDGETVSSYLDYPSFINLNSIPSNGYDDLNGLSYDEESKTYTFNVAPKGKNGTTLLRYLGMSCIYETYPSQMFPSSTGTNDYESGYFGEGKFTLKEDGGFSFFYYVSVISQVSSSGNVSYQMAIEIETSDIGTTTIEEYESL